MTTTTKLEAFYLCQKQARGVLGKTLIADQIATTALGVGVVDDLSEFGYTRMGGDEQNGLYIWRPDFDDDDELKRITTVTPSLGRVQVESAWSDQTNKNYVLIGIHPFMVLDAMDAGYSRMVIRKDVVLTIGGYDLDMERPDAAAWDDYLTNATVSKEEADPQNKVTGDFALKIMLTAAGGKARGPAVRTVPGHNLIVAPCLRVVGGGPFTVRLYDLNHSTYFGETQTYNGAEFAYLLMKGTVPAGCDYWQIEIAGTDSGAIAWLDSVAARTKEQRQFEMPSLVDEPFKLPLIHRVKFNTAIISANKQYAAPSREFAGDLVLDTHYHLQSQETEARPNILDFEPDIDLGEDIFYMATRRMRTDVEPWTNKTDVTTASRGELVAYCMAELSSLLLKETKDSYWASEKTRWETLLGDNIKARIDPPYQPARVWENVKV